MSMYISFRNDLYPENKTFIQANNRYDFYE